MKTSCYKKSEPNTAALFESALVFGRIVLIDLYFICAATGPGHAAPAQNSPGTLDATFIKGAGADGFLRVVAVQPDGKVLMGGNFNMVRGVNNALLTRLNQDGAPDAGFISPFPAGGAPRIYTVGVQTDGRILAAGMFTAIGGTLRTNIARLQADGTFDPSFNSGAGPSGLVRIMALQPDGRILIGGEFTTVNKTNRNRVARLNADGSLDLTFDPGTGADNIVRTVALLPTGQVLVGGLFTSFNGHPSKFLVRLNANGTLDASFPAGSGPNSNVYFAAPQPDGKIFISGDFTAVNGTNINRVARLWADGSLDTSFSPAGGALGGPVYHVIRQENGRIVIGGGFTTVNGATLNRLARLNPDGSLDPDFNPGAGADNEVLTLAIQGDGKLLAGGLFATYESTNVGMIARIYGDPLYPSLDAQLADSSHLLVAWPLWASAYTLQANESLQAAGWQTVTNMPTPQNTRQAVTVPIPGRAQFYRLISP